MASADSPTDLPHSLLFEAAHWYARLKADNASPDDHAQWSQWIASCPAHRQAWHRIQEVLCHLNKVPAHLAVPVLASNSNARNRPSRRRKPP